MLHANGTEIPIQYAFDEQYHLQIFGESLHELPSNETFLVRITHQGISYPLSKSLGNFFNTKNSIALECNANLGKRSNTEKQITQEGAAISVFPNPVSQYLSIKGIPETDNLCDISMLDMLGRSVLEVKQHPANKDLDVSKLPSGVYCLIIKQGHQHHRFLLNKE
jgi:hypothetical protein